jgi:hypothetical protein
VFFAAMMSPREDALPSGLDEACRFLLLSGAREGWVPLPRSGLSAWYMWAHARTH